MAVDQIEVVEGEFEFNNVSDESLEAAGTMAGVRGPSQMNCPHTMTCEI